MLCERRFSCLEALPLGLSNILPISCLQRLVQHQSLLPCRPWLTMFQCYALATNEGPRLEGALNIQANGIEASAIRSRNPVKPRLLLKESELGEAFEVRRGNRCDESWSRLHAPQVLSGSEAVPGDWCLTPPWRCDTPIQQTGPSPCHIKKGGGTGEVSPLLISLLCVSSSGRLCSR